MYEIFVAPGAMPVVNPVVAPTVAIVGVLLDHVPPVTVLLKVVVPPAQTVALPIMPDGAVNTESVLMA